MAAAIAAPSEATAGTISAPLDLSVFQTAKGDHEAVTVTGAGSSRQTRIKPMPKVTLTSLTKNNVSGVPEVYQSMFVRLHVSLASLRLVLRLRYSQSGTLRKLNSVVLPIVYSDKFYKDILDDSLEDINKIIYYGDVPVGAICGRFDNMSSASHDKPATLVILTLAILAPYRHQRLGTALLTRALQNTVAPALPPKALPSTEKIDKPVKGIATVAVPRKSVKRAVAHVQVGNEAAKRFYQNFGFKEVELVKDFYSKLDPRDAYLMECEDIEAGLKGLGAA